MQHAMRDPVVSEARPQLSVVVGRHTDVYGLVQPSGLLPEVELKQNVGIMSYHMLLLELLSALEPSYLVLQSVEPLQVVLAGRMGSKDFVSANTQTGF